MICLRCHADAYACAWETGEHLWEVYDRLTSERTGERACTPEQQAGPEAADCLNCNRRCVHPCGVCVACGVDQKQWKEGRAAK